MMISTTEVKDLIEAERKAVAQKLVVESLSMCDEVRYIGDQQCSFYVWYANLGCRVTYHSSIRH